MDDLTLLAGQAAQYGFPMVIAWCPVGTDGRETGEPDPEHRTAAHNSEDGIEISTVLYFIRKNSSATGSFHRAVASDQKGAVKK